MANPSSVPVMDLEVFKGYSYDLSFEAKELDTDGVTVIGPYDLTGKTVHVIFNEIFAADLELISGAGFNANGSKCEITDAAGGKFLFHLSATELAAPVTEDGYWRIDIREPPNDAILFVRGPVRVLPFRIGGQI